jgi:ABC-type branched-subunit amino acid transport system ATPase component
LLDEPSAGMGATEREALASILRQLLGVRFQTLLIVDHDISFVQGLCENTVVLDFGQRIAAGSTAEVLSDQRVVEAYLGLPMPTTTESIEEDLP